MKILMKSDSGFTVDTNRVTIIDSQGEPTTLPLLSKDEVAEKIIHLVIAKLSEKVGPK